MLWPTVFTIYGDTPDVPPTKKKLLLDNDLLFHEFFFVQLLVFEIWSILYMVDFDDVTSCMQNRPYTKSTISQKLEVAPKKTLEL